MYKYEKKHNHQWASQPNFAEKKEKEPEMVGKHVDHI